MAGYDLVIRNGQVFTGGVLIEADIAVSAGRIAAVGLGLAGGASEIDAKGLWALPGGVDPHAHVEQLSVGGRMNADTFESATGAAALGGTTSLICFAAQHRGLDLVEVVRDYAARAERGAIIDCGFHLMITEATPKIVGQDLPYLTTLGHRSIKLFLTYDHIRIDDEGTLDVLAAARANGALTCVHAENHGMIKWMVRKLEDSGYTAPKFHAVSHPRAAEIEAIHRIIAFSRFLDVPVMVFHVSTAEGAAIIRQARAEGVRVQGETCPHYLLMTAEVMDKPGLEGAKWMCSPPPRTPADQEALWGAVARDELQIVSSDHAPYAYDASGKLHAGPNATFKQIANGMPGLQVRQPLMFDAGVNRGRISLARFVELTSTTPARSYGLAGKGEIAPGKDADLALWDAKRSVTIPDVLHDRTGYSPYAGRKITGWPMTVLRRGEVIVRDGELIGQPGSGKVLLRDAYPGATAGPNVAAELDPARNHGAKLI